MTDDTTLDRALAALNDGAWLDDYRDEIGTRTGADVTGLTVGRNGITIHGHEKFGDGQEPYAADPTHHIEMLNHDDRTGSEGVVVYEDGPTDDEYPLRLPKHLYFEEDRDFDAEVNTVDDLHDALNDVLTPDIPVKEIVAATPE